MEPIKITELSKKGHGLALLPENDQPVEVLHTIPGDEVKVRLLGKRKGIRGSVLEEIVTPSADRVEPRCAHFGRCGGCRLQQMDYLQQLKVKERLVRRALTNDVEIAEDAWHPIIPCEPPWNYRNKMEFSFSQDNAGQQFLGLMIPFGRGRVMNITECHLTGEWMVETLAAVRDWWAESGLDAYYPPKNSGSLRTLTLREGITTGERMAVLLVSGCPEYALSQPHLDSLVAVLEKVNPQGISIYLRIQQAQKGRPTQFYEMHLAGAEAIRESLCVNGRTLTFNISPAAFFQPNTRQAERLYSRALDLAAIPAGETVYDLYCGTGTLGMCAARDASKVIGIELSPESALDARENAKTNGITNFEILTGDVGKVLKQLEESGRPHTVMVDPPRAGLDERALECLIELKPKQILYISCNPGTQGPNLAVLVAAGYHVHAVQPVDQFPHTIHIENIVVLRERD